MQYSVPAMAIDKVNWKYIGSRTMAAKRTTSKTQVVTRSAVTGQFVSASSSAFNYYANNDKARKAAEARFDSRVTVTQDSSNPSSSGKKYRRGA